MKNCIYLSVFCHKLSLVELRIDHHGNNTSAENSVGQPIKQ